MNKLIIAGLVGALLIGVPAFTAQAGVIESDLQMEMRLSGPGQAIPVIISFADKAELHQFKDGSTKQDRQLLRSRIIASLKEKAGAARGPLMAFLRGRGVKDIKDLWIINGVGVSLPADQIEELARWPMIESIRQDAEIRISPGISGTAAAPEWNIAAIGAPYLWGLGVTGAGVVVASLDTGVDLNHPDLRTRWRGGVNSWFDPNGQHATPADVSGHGTQTMGIMVGGDAGGISIGVAPDARWIAAKIYNDAGVASYSIIHLAFQWLLDPDDTAATDDAPDVVNLSWGILPPHTCNTEFEPDIEVLKAAFIAIAASAGNYGPYGGSDVSPANYPESFAVGALDQYERIASFSSRGPSTCDQGIFPELVAPGVNIKTAGLTADGVFPDSYAYVSGTSFSAPHVAGAMALLLQAVPGATVAELERALVETAQDLGSSGPDQVYGYGEVDVIAATRFLAGCDGSCANDRDRDGDIDGLEVAAAATALGSGAVVDLAALAKAFGRTDCRLCE